MDTKRGYYSILLSLIDKLFEGEIDQQTFEECVRYIFGGDAYIMFTIDKLVLSLVRDVSGIEEKVNGHVLTPCFVRFTSSLPILNHKSCLSCSRLRTGQSKWTKVIPPPIEPVLLES